MRFKLPASEWFCLWLIKLKLNVFGGVVEMKIYILSNLSFRMIILNILLGTHIKSILYVIIMSDYLKENI